MRHITHIAAALTLVVVGTEPAMRQRASLELVARFHHLMHWQLRHDLFRDKGSYVVAAKPLFEESGNRRP